MTLTKQNITELIYKTTLINNTDLQQSEALTDLMVRVFSHSYVNLAEVLTALDNGTITLDTYIYFTYNGGLVDTAGRVLEKYPVPA